MTTDPHMFEYAAKARAQPELLAFRGERVAVFWAAPGVDRASFGCQVSVTGTLEQNSVDPHQWRVLVADGSYSYFQSGDVRSLLARRSHPTSDGACAVIRL